METRAEESWTGEDIIIVLKRDRIFHTIRIPKEYLITEKEFKAVPMGYGENDYSKELEGKIKELKEKIAESSQKFDELNTVDNAIDVLARSLKVKLKGEL